MHGAFVLHKPEGITSSDCVTQIKRALIQNGYTGSETTDKKIRIGHGGTLDPFATGVLVVLFGEATKLADTYLHSRKAYSGIISLGEKTSTADLTGETLEKKAVPSLSEGEWQELATQFMQEEYLQTPPMYSAKKIDGVAMHVHARKGETVERAAILKKIFNFDLRVKSESHLEFSVECESGTYVRTLAEDLAARAGTVAHLKTLCRTKSSDCFLEDSIELNSLLDLLAQKTSLSEIEGYRPFSKLGSHISKLEIDANAATALRQGKTAEVLKVCTLANETLANEKYVIARAGEPVALLSHTPPALYRLQCVFNEVKSG